jgi:hypothetical protein
MIQDTEYRIQDIKNVRFEVLNSKSILRSSATAEDGQILIPKSHIKICFEHKNENLDIVWGFGILIHDSM